jgi:hypothetical protein
MLVAGLALVVGAAGLWLASTPTPRPPCLPYASGDSVACSTIDGFPVGQFSAACSPQSNNCLESQTLAALDARDRGHSPVRTVWLYGID